MSNPERPNLLLILTDHFRGDCLSRLGHPDAETPHLDALSADGYCFSRAYSPAPSCIPARRSLMTGQTPYTQGFTGYLDNEPWDYPVNFAGEITKNGYQTINIGKTHFHPSRAHLGFEQLIIPADYDAWLAERPEIVTERNPHGILNNSWMARPHPFPETHLEETWFTGRALDFLDRHDPTRPWFLCLSFNGPHPPWTPPQAYWDLFKDRTFAEPAIGDWAEHHAAEARYPLDPNAWRGKISDSQMQRARAGYFATLNYLDAQVGRLVNQLQRRGLYDNTAILFTSDHGEMLGDHHLWRKTYAYEASARIPWIFKPPSGLDTAVTKNQEIQTVVGWEDIMPTFIDLAGGSIPETVEGRSVLPLIQQEDADWRDYYHGEHATEYHADNACQFLTDATWKYIWNPCTGGEQLFDLQADPLECRDLAGDPDHAEILTSWRQRLIEHLAGRDDDMSDGKQLTPQSQPPRRGALMKKDHFE